MRSTRILAVLGAVLAVAVLVGACGGSSPSKPASSAAAATGSTGGAAGITGASGAAARRTQLSACLKKYGVTLPARFGGTGASGPFRRFGATGGTGRFFGRTGASGRAFGATGATGRGFFGGGGAFFDNPKFAAAMAKCGGLLGGFGGRFGGAGGTGARGTFNPSSTAQRAAITSYVACMKRNGFTLPTPNFSGTEPVFGTHVNRTSTAFISANAKCSSLLGSLAPTPPPGGGAPGTSGG